MLLRMSARSCALIAVLPLLTATPAYAQQATNAQIAGLVTDATGAAVPGASVKAMNTATNVEYPTLSNEAGVYVLPNLVPGPYRITVTKEGFKTQVQSSITARVADRLAINFQLEPGEVRTTVEVTAAAEASASDLRIHFGLGEDKVAREIEIRWPSGRIEKLTNVRCDQVLELTEPAY